MRPAWLEFSMSKPIVSLTLIVLLFCAAHCLAQQGTGGIFGTVTDPVGAPIVGANVTALDVATNVVTKGATGANGAYIFPRLPVGNYTVTAEQSGFKSLVRTGVVLQVDQRAEVNLQLSLGSV